jgi:hypothetical protein
MVDTHQFLFEVRKLAVDILVSLLVGCADEVL